MKLGTKRHKIVRVRKFCSTAITNKPKHILYIDASNHDLPNLKSLSHRMLLDKSVKCGSMSYNPHSTWAEQYVHDNL